MLVYNLVDKLEIQNQMYSIYDRMKLRRVFRAWKHTYFKSMIIQYSEVQTPNTHTRTASYGSRGDATMMEDEEMNEIVDEFRRVSQP